MSFDRLDGSRLDGRGYKISTGQTNDSQRVLGLGLALGNDGGKNCSSVNDPAASQERRASSASSDDLEHLRAKAASAELQKKNTDLLLRSEQQRNKRLSASLDELQARHDDINNLQLKEIDQLKMALSNKDNQIVQKALQLDQQRKELEEQKEENTRLNQLISNKKEQLVQKALEIEELTKETSNVRRALRSLTDQNETLAAIGEELSINFAQKNIKYSTLSDINIDLQNSTSRMQSVFEDNLQALDALRVENSELKSKLQSTTAIDHCNDKQKRIMSKLHQRRELLALVKAARNAAETRAIADEAQIGFPTAEKIQAEWKSFVQNNDAIVTVLRGREWIEAIDLKRKDSCLNWVEYCCDGVSEAVSEEKIKRKRKQRPCYFESPTTPSSPKRKRSKGSFTFVSRRA